MEVDSGKILTPPEDFQYIDSDSKDNTDDEQLDNSRSVISILFLLLSYITTALNIVFLHDMLNLVRVIYSTKDCYKTTIFNKRRIIL